jgi:hypothetical protein
VCTNSVLILWISIPREDWGIPLVPTLWVALSNSSHPVMRFQVLKLNFGWYRTQFLYSSTTHWAHLIPIYFFSECECWKLSSWFQYIVTNILIRAWNYRVCIGCLTSPLHFLASRWWYAWCQSWQLNFTYWLYSFQTRLFW